MEQRSPLRILQVLGDTDADDPGRTALDLHGALDRRGQAVRSVALGPGRRGGLDGLLPVLGPSPRSVSARTQLRRERRWADVVVLHGPVAVDAASSRWLRGGPPTVAVLDTAGLRAAAWGPAGPTQVRALVVTTSDGKLPAPDLLPGGCPCIVAVPVSVDVRAGPTTSRERAEARRMLGLDPTVAVVRLVEAGSDPAAVRRWSEEIRRAGMSVLDPSGDVEVDTAAADVVAWPGSASTALPPRELLASAASGAAAVVGGAAAATLVEGGALIVEDGGDVARALRPLREPGERRSRGDSAAELVRRHHDLDDVASALVEVLADVVG